MTPIWRTCNIGIRETNTQSLIVNIVVSAVFLLSPSDSIYDKAGDAALNILLVEALTKVLKKKDQS